eukprot:m51a1_g877 hypothetical protein (2159) ;mRNA; r:872897-880908
MGDDEDWDKEFNIEGAGTVPLKLCLATPVAAPRSKTQDIATPSPATPLSASPLKRTRSMTRSHGTGGGPPQPRRKSVAPPVIKADQLGDEEDEDEDEHETDARAAQDEAAPTKLRGILADPNKIETGWEADFDFGDEDDDAPPKLSGTGTAPKALPVEKDVADLKYILNCIPNSHGRMPSASDGSLFGILEALPTWLPPKPSADEEAAAGVGGDTRLVQARNEWRKGVELLLKDKAAEALSAFNSARSLNDDVDPFHDDVFFEGQLGLHMSVACKMLTDVFQQTDHLKRASDIVPENPPSTQPEMAWLRAVLSFELAQRYADEAPATALPLAIKFLRYTLLGSCSSAHSHTRKCVPRSLRWSHVARACTMCSKCLRALSFGEATAFKCASHAQRAARLVKGDDTILTSALKLSRGHRPGSSSSQSFAHPKTGDPRASSPSCTSPVGSSPGEHGQGHHGSGSDTMSHTQSEAEDEDWDAEFGIDTQAKPVVLSIRLSTTEGLGPVGPVSKVMPLRHKVLDALANKPIELVRFPPPTFLYTLRTDSGHSFLHENELEDWLRRVVSKNVEPGARDHKFARALSEAGVEALEIAGQLWKSDHQSDWLGMVQAELTLCSVFQSSMPAIIALAESEAYASSMMSSMKSTAPAQWGPFSPDPLRVFVSTYMKLRDSGEKKAPSQGNLIAKMRALVDAHLFFTKCDPYSLSKANEFEIPARDDLVKVIGDYNARIKEICELYPKIPISPLKAKACYALAMARITLGDWSMAEKMLFETLFIIDKVTQERRGFPLIISSMGVTALKQYGEVLLHNSKYQYAVCSWEAAILCADILKRNKDHFSLLRRLAEVAHENNDVDRSIAIYDEIMSHYLSEVKINEIVFVSNVLADLHQDRGDFAEAELVLTRVLRVLSESKPRTFTDSLPVDPQFISMEQRLAQLQLHSFYLERGIETLEAINIMVPRKTKKQAALALLAQAYSKKCWFNDCKGALFSSNLDRNDTTPVAARRKNTGPGASDLTESSTLRQDVLIEQCVCMSRNFVNAKRLTEAFYLIDCAITVCPISQLVMRGSLIYRRAKILQLFCQRSSKIQFPSTLKDTPTDTPLRALQCCVPHTFSSYGDLLQEAIASFKKAYQCFLTLGDDIRIAKVMARMSEVMLQYVLPASTLLKLTYDDVARMPTFEPSPIVAPAPKGSSPAPSPAPKEFVLSTDVIESPATLAMDIASDTCYLPLLPSCLLSMAELRILQGEKEASLAYLKECKDLVLSIYFDGPVFMWKSCSARTMKRILSVVRRMARLLLCMDKAVINANLIVLDALVLLQHDYEDARKRGMRVSYIFDSLGSSSATPRLESYADSGSSESDTPGSVVERRRSMRMTVVPPTTPMSAPLKRVAELAGAVDIPREVSRTLPSPPPGSQGASQQAGTMSPQTPRLPESITRNKEHEQCAQESWGLMHRLRAQTTRYSQGKSTRPELLMANQAILRDVLVSASQGRSRPLPSSGVPIVRHSLGAAAASPPGASSAAAAAPAPSPSPIPTRQGSLVAQAAAASVASPGKTVEVDTTYKLDEFMSKHPKLFPKLSYVLQLDWMVAYYLPSTGQLHVDVLTPVPYPERLQPKAQPFLVNLHLLQTPSDFGLFKILPETTIGELFDELCRYYNETLPPPPGLSHTPTGDKGSQTHPQRRLSKSAAGRSPVMLESTPEFMNEIAKLSTKLQPDAWSVGPMVVAGKQVVYGPRLAARQLGLAKQAKSMTSGFSQLTRPPTALVSSCFSAAELQSTGEKVQKPLDLYLYGVAGQVSTESTASLTPLALSAKFGAFLPSLLATRETPEVSEPIPSVQDVAADLSRVFRSFVAMLPLPADTAEKQSLKTVVQSQANVISGSLERLMPPPAPAAAPRRHGIGAIKDAIFSSKDKAEPPVTFRPSSTYPTIVICSKFLSCIPWELFLGDEPVLRYLSFFDLVRSIKKSGLADKDKVVPSYWTCYYGYGEKEAAVVEEKRGRFLVADTASQLWARTMAVEMSRDLAAIAPFSSPLCELHAKKGISSIRKKYKYLRFFDVVQLEQEGSKELLAFVDEGAYPVILMSFADLIDMSQIIVALMRLRPACTALIVQSEKVKAAARRIMRVHEQLVAQQALSAQNRAELNDRYHFLMAVVTEVRRDIASPVALLNPPTPV